MDDAEFEATMGGELPKATLPESLLHRMRKTERLGEEILIERQQVIDYDRRRNTNREALGELTRRSMKDSSKVWINFGNLFIRMNKPVAVKLVEDDQQELTSVIDSLRDGLVVKAQKLREHEGDEGGISKGWGLKSVNTSDMSQPAI